MVWAKSFADIQKENKVVKASTGTWESRRYIVRADEMGFSMHHTIIYKGTSTFIWYKNHLEGVFVFQGEGEIEVVNDKSEEGKGRIIPISAGILYCLDKHDKHFLRATTSDVHMVCCFNPPVDGKEDHDARGVYPVIPADGQPIYDVEGHHTPRIFPPPKPFRDRMGAAATSAVSTASSCNLFRDLALVGAGAIAFKLFSDWRSR